MITLVLYRRAGASLPDIARKLRNWRPMLRQCTWQDVIATLRLRSLGRILMPARGRQMVNFARIGQVRLTSLVEFAEEGRASYHPICSRS